MFGNSTLGSMSLVEKDATIYDSYAEHRKWRVNGKAVCPLHDLPRDSLISNAEQGPQHLLLKILAICFAIYPNDFCRTSLKQLLGGLFISVLIEQNDQLLQMWFCSQHSQLMGTAFPFGRISP